jgi:hypothetical protein
LRFVQLHHVAHAQGGRWRIFRKDLLHNPAGNAALLRDLGLLRSIVIVIPRLRLQCCKEVEGGESGCNVVRRDRIRVCLGGRVSWCPFNEAEVAAKLLVELAERSEARTCPSVWLGEFCSLSRCGGASPSTVAHRVSENPLLAHFGPHGF